MFLVLEGKHLLNHRLILRNIKESYTWESRLKSTNDLLHLGPEKFEDAVKGYGKIVEILLRHLYKEVFLTIPYRKKREVFEVEEKVSGGKPFEKLGLGQMIRIFSRSSLFDHINKLLKVRIDPAQLNEINDLRVKLTHYDEDVKESKVDRVREYTTDILLQFKLIREDPEKVVEIKEKPTEPDALKIMKENLARELRKIRLEVFGRGKTIIEESYGVESGDGWYSQVEIKAEIVGIYLDEHNMLNVLVKVLQAYMPESFYASNEEEEGYDRVRSKVKEIIRDIDPNIEQNLKVLILDEEGWSRVENSSYEFSAD